MCFDARSIGHELCTSRYKCNIMSFAMMHTHSKHIQTQRSADQNDIYVKCIDFDDDNDDDYIVVKVVASTMILMPTNRNICVPHLSHPQFAIHLFGFVQNASNNDIHIYMYRYLKQHHYNNFSFSNQLMWFSVWSNQSAVDRI